MDKEKNLSPYRNLTQHRAGAQSTELPELMESRHSTEFVCRTGVLRTARISTVEVMVSSDKCHVDQFLFHIKLPRLKFHIFIHLSGLLVLT